MNNKCCNEFILSREQATLWLKAHICLLNFEANYPSKKNKHLAAMLDFTN